ncbi:MAG: hypothetical protein ACRD88_06620, partial [Terriglobia bacterium]
MLLQCGLLASIACLGMAASAQEAGAPSDPAVVFAKEFPGSVPPYYSVTVRESGEAVYRTEPADEAPIEFRLPAEVAGEIFSLARKLGPQRGATLESKRRVANMGRKTLEYRSGDEHSTASFNHTEVPEALALLGLFERISETQQHLLRLQYLIQFDRLGVVKALLQLEMDFDKGRLIGPARLVPILEQIVRDRAVVQLAKGRATLI